MNTKLHNIDIIGYDSGWGCADYGCEDGPDAVNATRILAALSNMGLQAKWQGSLGLRRLVGLRLPRGAQQSGRGTHHGQRNRRCMSERSLTRSSSSA